MKENGGMEKRWDKESSNILKEKYMRAAGLMTKLTVLENTRIQMEQLTKANGLWTYNKAKALKLGLMALDLKVSMKKGKRKGWVHTYGLMELLILVSG